LLSARAVRAVVTTVTVQIFETVNNIWLVSFDVGSHAHSAVSANRGEFVKIRRALLTVAGGAAAALIAASPALAAGTWQVDSGPHPAGNTFPS
jgi:hypothetical protein